MRLLTIKIISFSFVFLTIYCFLYYFSDRFNSSNTSIQCINYKLERLKNNNDEETIIIGDSRSLVINYGNDNVQSVYNYSFQNAGGMYPYVYFLKKYLKTNPAPKKILWSFIPLTLSDRWEIFKTSPPKFSSSVIYRSSKLYSIFDIINIREHPIFFEYFKTTKSLLHRKIYFDPDGFLSFFKKGPRDISHKFDKKTGGLLTGKNKTWTPSGNTYLETVKELNVSKLSLSLAKDFLELAENNNTKVYLFNMPIPDTVHHKRTNSLFYKKYNDAIMSLKALYPDTLYVYEKILHYEDNLFRDGSHLNLLGLQRFQNSDYDKVTNFETYH